ncbi:MAG: hypothetical protein E7035_00360 [Verrucomicrobiaceae bacterium]|nr:hypothetical protein [Verrucomicrobiaceae bacterium]
MKNILKYALILAAASLAGAVYAQDAQTAKAKADSGLAVSTAIKDGVITIHVEGQCKSKMVSAKDELEILLKQALEAVGAKTHLARAVESAFAAIKSHLADPNEPAFGPIKMHLVVKPNDDTAEIITDGDILLAREQYVANMKSTFNDDNTVTTTGNVKKISSNGGQETLGTIVDIDANGNITTRGGAVESTDKTVAAKQSDSVVNPNTVENPVAQENAGTIIPDNTIVTSSTK